jgi:hypothetical protein
MQDDCVTAPGQMAGKCSTQAMTGTSYERELCHFHSPVLP